MDIDKILLVIIILNILMSIKGFNDKLFFDKYKFLIGAINRGEKIRMFSSAFLHVDYLHLILNMYVLFIFAPQVIGYFGSINFLIIYIGSLLAGNVYTLIMHKKELYYSAVGASGAVAGVVYSTILLSPNMTLFIFPLPIPIPAYIFGIGYLLYSIYGMKKQLGNVGHSAHLGGAMGGFILTLLLRPSLIMHHTTTVILLGIPIVLLLVFGNKIKNS